MEFLRFVLLGLGGGALYALAAQGIILVYRGSGIINFAQGAMGMVVAYVFYDMRDDWGWDWRICLVLATVLAAAMGVVMHVAVMRPLRRATLLSRMIATLGVLLFLRELALWHWTSSVRVVSSNLPRGVVELLPDTALGVDRIILLGAAIALTVGLAWFYTHARFGLASSAVAENQEATAALGWSPDLIAAANWAAGAALGGLAAIFMAPIASLGPEMTLLVVPALAAALVGRFASFTLTFVSALAIGIAESLMARYVSEPGWAKSVPFLLIIVVLVLRGRALPGRGEASARLPRVGDGRVSPVTLILAIGGAVALIQWLSVGWVDALASTFTFGIVLLSLIVLTGFTGQLSLAQYTIAGMGAFVAGRLIDVYDVPYEIALLAGVVGAIPIGVIVGLPALRTRGVNLAVATLGLALVLERLVLANTERTGGIGGTEIGEARLFGVEFGALAHPERYALLGLVAFVIVGLSLANLRRGRTGRRLLAVRANERAAASLGISVLGAKIYAFGLASAIAGLGGVLIAYRHPRVVYTRFGVFDSIYATVQAVIGGIGFITGALLGSAGSPGAFIPYLFHSIGNIDQWVRLFAGIGVVLMLVQAPDGLAWMNIKAAEQFRTRFGRQRAQPVIAELAEQRLGAHGRVRSAALAVDGLRVRFGGVVAVDGVSLRVEPGEVVGLIGPNGAGKTTVIDAITGYVQPEAGSITLDGRPIHDLSPTGRARAGVGRSFQSLELFEDMTIYDNLRTASDGRDRRAYLTDLVRPGRVPLRPAGIAAVHEFGLADDLLRLPGELAFGRRRLVAIARAIAMEPSVLLLDEPAAGLDQRETAELGELIRRLADEWGLAVLLIEHDVGLVLSVCDRIEAIDFGRSIASGTPQEISSSPAVISAYLGEPETEDDDRQPAGVAAEGLQ